MGLWRCHLTSSLGILYITRWVLAITIGISIAAGHRFPAFGASPLLQQRNTQEQQAIGLAKGKQHHHHHHRRLLNNPELPSRWYSSGRKGQCLMGIKGLTGYVNKFRGAVPVEELRQVRASTRRDGGCVQLAQTCSRPMRPK